MVWKVPRIRFALLVSMLVHAAVVIAVILSIDQGVGPGSSLEYGENIVEIGLVGMSAVA